MVDVNIVIGNGRHILVGMKAHIRRSDIVEIVNIGRVYGKKKGLDQS